MRLEELDFDLPAEAIAQRPSEPRDDCRLMRLVGTGEIEHGRFSGLRWMLRPDDILVLNDSKVLPARVQARKSSGGMVEILFVRPAPASEDPQVDRWEALVKPSRRLRPGGELLVGDSDRLILDEALGEGRWVLRSAGGRSLVSLMQLHGQLPLPPYIRTYPDDPSQYQTVYAAEAGSAAAPTAGLHFTRELLRDLPQAGIDVTSLTLHVGLDTFLPIRESRVEDHIIHTESYEVPAATMEKLRATRAGGGRVVAVGTTVTRVLETLGRQGALESGSEVRAIDGSTGIFITPGYEFMVTDVMLTNFHLPRSSVLALTMAFAGVERIKSAYAEALARGYRFFSFGDAMLVEKMAAESSGEGPADAVR